MTVEAMLPGSSPPKRGKLLRVPCILGAARFIPTGVGKRIATGGFQKDFWFIPTGVRKTPGAVRCFSDCLDHPRRSGETAEHSTSADDEDRFIPTKVGKAFVSSPGGAGLRDSGGEASRLIPTGVGKRDLPEKFLYVDWFIPTGVRKTLPRVRAEPDSVTVEALPPGSSPRAWGKPMTKDATFST